MEGSAKAQLMVRLASGSVFVAVHRCGHVRPRSRRGAAALVLRPAREDGGDPDRRADLGNRIVGNSDTRPELGTAAAAAAHCRRFSIFDRRPRQDNGSAMGANGLTDDDWSLLLSRIKSGKCTPFLGAGAAAGTLPVASDIAKRWAEASGYPLNDPHDLARVAQYVAVRMGDAMIPKERICEELANYSSPDFSQPDEPHGFLASLPLPVFVTTNYDDFMAQALRRNAKEPRLEICRWNQSPAVKAERVVLTPGVIPTPAVPVVFHLHGRLSVPESLVLTEDDYLDFLVAVSKEPKLLPHQIQRALAGSSLLFIGYRLADWNFRVIHRGLVMAGESSLRRLSVTVQLRASTAERQLSRKIFPGHERGRVLGHRK